MKQFKVRPRPGRGRKPLHGATPSTMAGQGPGTHEEPRECAARVGVETAPVRTPNAISSSPVREDDRGELQEWMCGAKLRGERSGLLCRNPKMKGSPRCRMHGSASLVAREKAAERIMAASDFAARKLISFMSDPAAPYSVKLAAARDLLDRSDLAGKTKVELEMPAFERLAAQAVKMRRPSGDDEPDRYSAVEAGTVNQPVIEGRVVLPALEPADEPEPITHDSMAVPEQHVSSSDRPPASVRRKTPGYVDRSGERRTRSEMRP